MPFVQAQTMPVKVASQGRFDLSSPTVKLEKGEVLAGNGQIQRMNWQRAEEQARGYTANFAVTRFGWNKIAVRFLPSGDGEVELRLMGPFEAATAGRVYRQEVLWDAVEVSGAVLENGGFEEGAVGGIPFSGRSIPTGWKSGGGVVQRGAGLEGGNAARTWHNETLSATLKVKGGEPVTIRMQARAFVPAGYPEMRSLGGKTTPAQEAAKGFLKGANFGNYLEAPPGQSWGAKYTEADCAQMQREGFDHVRIPIAWHHYAGPGPEFKISDAAFAKVDYLVTNALKHRLNVIVNIHHFDAFTDDPTGQKAKFFSLWRQIAAHYAAAPKGLGFELLNEPKDKATTVAMNPIYAEAIKEIRKTNPSRVIFVGPGKWNSIDELGNLLLPDDDENLIVTVHCYEPFYFTHQGATWSGNDTKVKGIRFPGPPEKPLVPDPGLKIAKHVADWIQRYNTLPTERNPSSPASFRGKIKLARQWSDHYGRPVHMGEFGCFTTADAESRANFYRAFRKTLDEHQIGWAIWDWKAGFKYWDEKTQQPVPGMREAIFGR